MENEQGKVFISDTGEAVYLFTLHFKLLGLERVDEKRVSFVFAATDGIEKAISDFCQDKRVEVPIQTLFNNFRLLKGRLFTFK